MVGMTDGDRRPTTRLERDAVVRRAHHEIAASSSESGPYLPSGGRRSDEPWSARRAVNVAVAMLIILGLAVVAAIAVATMDSGSDDGPTPASTVQPVSRE